MDIDDIIRQVKPLPSYKIGSVGIGTSRNNIIQKKWINRINPKKLVLKNLTNQ